MRSRARPSQGAPSGWQRTSFLAGAPLAGETFSVEKLSLGYICDFLERGALSVGIGGLASTYSYPAALNPNYGYRPTSYLMFVRARL